MAPIKPTAVPTALGVYPHLDQITDFPTNQTAKLLWDRVHQLEARLQAQEGTSTTIVGAVNAHDSQLTAQAGQIRQALTIRQLSSAGGGGGANTPGGGNMSAATPTNHLDIVNAAIASLGITAASSEAMLFVFIRTVVWNISQLGADPAAGSVGLLHQDAGDGVFTCSGQTYACFRLCYDNGANIKVLTGSFTGQWSQEADVSPSDWRAPVSPSYGCS